MHIIFWFENSSCSISMYFELFSNNSGFKNVTFIILILPFRFVLSNEFRWDINYTTIYWSLFIYQNKNRVLIWLHY